MLNRQDADRINICFSGCYNCPLNRPLPQEMPRESCLGFEGDPAGRSTQCSLAPLPSLRLGP